MPACDLGLKAQLPVNNTGCCKIMFAGAPCCTVVYEYIVLLLLTLPRPPEPPAANESEPFHASDRQPEKCNFDLILGPSEMCLYTAQRWGKEESKARTPLRGGEKRNGSTKEHRAPFKGPFSM